MQSSSPSKSKNLLIRIHLLVVLLGVIVIIAVVLIPTRAVDDDSGGESRASEMAMIASRAEAETGDVLAPVYANISAFVSSPKVTALSPQEQGMVRAELFRRDTGEAPPNLPRITIEMSLSDALLLKQNMEKLRQHSKMLSDYYAGNEDVADIQGSAVADAEALANYLTDPTLTNIRMIAARTFQLQSEAKAMVPALEAEAQSHRESLLTTTQRSREAALAAAGVVGAALLLMTLLLGRRINRALAAAESEKRAMEAATNSLEFRNSQLSALYNVFTQITETLSLQYVVNTTIRETLKLMRADVAILRLLKDGMLVPAGAMQANSLPVERTLPIELGEGLVGQTAQHGRTLRIDESNEDQMSEALRKFGNRSALIVPLIVGARVVGVLNCWSQQPNAFSEDDQRIMEMMASQVATAVVAADTHEASVQSAHHDPLTGLSNRRQLDHDMANVLPQRLEQGEATCVAMVDIDHFSLFNNNYGHRMGDITLQKVAHVLKSSIRESDRVYRYGGEEFLVVFDAGLVEGERLAERLRVAIADTPHIGENMQPIGPITISVGVAAYPEHGARVEVITENADAALRQAKERGRNRVVVWTPATQGLNVAA